MSDRICTFPGCTKPDRSKGHCAAHAEQRRKGQELRPLQPYAKRQRRDPDAVCSVYFCDREASKRGMCETHYAASRRGGSFNRLDQSPAEWFFDRVREDDSGCWVWTKALNVGGYGSFRVGRDNWLAHRWSYEYMVAPIPDGLTIDHLCRNRSCVNPYHLEPVPMGVNTLRGFAPSAINARKTHCKHGHEFTPENTMRRKTGARRCRECVAQYNADVWKRRTVDRTA